MNLEPSFEGFVDTFNDGVVAGWALDQRQPGESIEVDLYIDGEYAGSAAADLPRPDLFAISPASQKKGFRFDVKPLIADCFLPDRPLFWRVARKNPGQHGRIALHQPAPGHRGGYRRRRPRSSPTSPAETGRPPSCNANTCTAGW
jgi:hypothetical protein